jgi:hypothetical protein
MHSLSEKKRPIWIPLKPELTERGELQVQDFDFCSVSGDEEDRESLTKRQ